MINFDVTILYQFGHFLLLLIILNFLLFKPVLRALDKRANTLKGLTDGADKAKDDRAELARSYDLALVEKRKPVIGNRDAILSAANKEAVHVIEMARNELSAELAKIRGEIEAEGKKVYDALTAEIGKLSAEAAQKILRRSI
jgi:F-type H+-transporting ATPase subunit b